MSNASLDFKIMEDATNTKNSDAANNNIRSFLEAGFRKLTTARTEVACLHPTAEHLQYPHHTLCLILTSQGMSVCAGALPWERFMRADPCGELQ